jgi:hypothetical protein
MPYDVGTGFLQIVPSFAGMVDSIEAEMEKDGEIAGETFKEAFENAARDLSISVGVDDSEAMAKLAELKAEEDTLDDKTLRINVEDDGSAEVAAAGLADLVAEDEALGGSLDDVDPKILHHVDTIDALASGAERAGTDYNSLTTALQRGNLDLDDVYDFAENAGISLDDFAASLANVSSMGSKMRPFWDELQSGAVDWEAFIPSLTLRFPRISGHLTSRPLGRLEGCPIWELRGGNSRSSSRQRPLIA